MITKKIFRAAFLFAAFFLFFQIVYAQTLLLLNSGRDYCYIYSFPEKKVLAKCKVCPKNASVTDIVKIKNGFVVVPHRIDMNIDAVSLWVFNRDFSKIVKKIPVAQSPYMAFYLDKSMVLVNHTFFSFKKRKFVGEIIDLSNLKVKTTLFFDGIPTGVINLFGYYYAVIEDVRGIIGGIRLVNLKNGTKILIDNPNLSSNIVSCNGELYCAVNGYGAKGYANSLFKITISPVSDRPVSIKKLVSFKKHAFPYILGSYKNYLIIGFTNHSIKGNFNFLCVYNTKTGAKKFLKVCFGPETFAYYKNKVFIAGLSKECLTVISFPQLKVKNIGISDTVPGFSSIRVID